MGKYSVAFYKGEYSTRQKQANSDKAKIYLEQHFNSTGRGFWTTADYAIGVVASNASKTSINFARDYAKGVVSEFDEISRVSFDDGVKVGGRGEGNLKLTKMPAIILEPMFVDDPEHVAVIKSEEGQKRLAKVLVCTIVKHIPQGGLIGFSVGHKYKRINFMDRGAKLLGCGYEADYAELVLKFAEEMLLKLK